MQSKTTESIYYHPRVRPDALASSRFISNMFCTCASTTSSRIGCWCCHSTAPTAVAAAGESGAAGPARFRCLQPTDRAEGREGGARRRSGGSRCFCGRGWGRKPIPLCSAYRHVLTRPSVTGRPCPMDFVRVALDSLSLGLLKKLHLPTEVLAMRRAVASQKSRFTHLRGLRNQEPQGGSQFLALRGLPLSFLSSVSAIS